MTEFERELSNLSYTNKDFSTIYPELLDLAKKLSYKWDPTTSNESDPGVVLLKLAALMADKTNYNIDKNILELFPLSVSQESNARQIFEQCGYCMKYYQSATTLATFSFVKDPDFSGSLKDRYVDDDMKRSATRRYDIPRFTMITNSDSSNVYTLVDPVFVDSTGYAHSVDTKVMQGVAMHYAVNGDQLITAENLDYQNRLYFSETNIAENGIFINHKGTENFDDWVKVDNLLIQPTKSTCYKFGLTDGGSTCYIEFPQDIVELIGEGINITYIVTDGASGNIGKNRLTQWYGDISLNVWDIEDADGTRESVTITNEHIKINNVLPATDGKDPETIDEAYKNYEKIKTTFDTLVTTADYSNALVTTHSASNGFVCDRTNDVQSSYVVMNTDLDTRRNTYVVKSLERRQNVELPVGTTVNGQILTEKQTVEAIKHDPELDAFDLRIYAFEYTDNDATLKSYVRSYTMTDDYGEESMKTGYFGAIHELKSINHNFQDFIENRIILIKNKFPLIARIIPSFKLTPTQQSEIVARVTSALYKQLHSSNVSFAEEGAYDVIYDTILTADPRIRALALDDLTYETYAVFKHQNQFHELRIDDGSQGYYALDSVSSDLFDRETGINYYLYVPSTDSYNKITDNKPVTNETVYSDEFVDLWKSFRKEVYARSVLAGNTSLFEDDNLVDWSANMVVDTEKMTDSAYYLKTDTTMKFVYDSSSNVYKLNEDKPIDGIYGIQANENLVFTRPSLIVEKSYASYVKVFYKIDHLYDSNSSTPTKDDQGNDRVLFKNSDYTLKTGEYIIFCWKTEDSDYAPYSYIRYDAGTIISPTYDMVAQVVDVKVQNTAEGGTPAVATRLLSDVYNLNTTFPQGTNSTATNLVLNPVGAGEEYAENPVLSIKEFSKPAFVLSGERQIDIKNKNVVELPKYIYFMMNDDSYTMFDTAHIDSIPTLRNGGIIQDGSNYTITESYTLQTGEYLIYTNESKTQLVMLEGGTRITRTYKHSSSDRRDPWYIDPYHQVSNSEIVSHGVDAIDNHWYTINSVEADGVTATETEYVQLGQNILVHLEFPADITDAELREALGANSDGSYRLQIPDEAIYNDDREEKYAGENKIIELKDSRMPLVDTVITYFTSETGSWRPTQLTRIDNTPELCWQVYGMLNVTCSDKNYQVLQAHQTVTALDSYQNAIKSYTNCSIKSNIAINGTGPLINVQTWNTSTSMYAPCSIVSFVLSDSESFKFVQSSNEGTCRLSGPRVLTSTIRDNTFSAGDYLDSTNNIIFNSGTQTISRNGVTLVSGINFAWNIDELGGTYENLVARSSDNGLLTITRTNESKYSSLPQVMTFDKYIFTSEKDKTTIQFFLPAGNYLLPITISDLFSNLQVTLFKRGSFTDNSSTSRLETSSTGTTVNIIQNEYSGAQQQFNWKQAPGRYFLKLTLDSTPFTYTDTDSSTYTATVTGYELRFNGTIDDANAIIIGSPYKYTHRKHLKSKNMNKYPYRPDDESDPSNPVTDFTDVLQYVVSLDTKRVFNYTYEIPDEYLIECPTSANSFLDKQHCLNACTICQWDVYSKNNSILVLNKLKQ